MLDQNTRITTSEQRRRRTRQLLTPDDTSNLPPLPRALPTRINPDESILNKSSITRNASDVKLQSSMNRIKSSLNMLKDSSQPRRPEVKEITAWVISDSDDETQNLDATSAIPSTYSHKIPDKSATVKQLNSNQLSKEQQSILINTIRIDIWC